MTGDEDIEIHPKAWGEEHWIVNTEYCGKKLVVQRGFRCSVHWHKLKDEVFYLISGLVLMEVNGTARVLKPGMKQYIRPGDKHRFTGLLDSEMMDFSTTHREDDSYRDTQSGKVPDVEFAALEALHMRGA